MDIIDLMNVGTALKRTGYHIDAAKAWLVGSTSGTAVSQSDNATTASTLKNTLGLSSKTGSTVNLYANWQPNTYTVTFDGNGATSGSMSSITATYDETVDIPSCGFKKTDYMFAGWSLSTNGKMLNKDDRINLTSTNNDTVTLYALWVKESTPVAIDTSNCDYVRIFINGCGNHTIGNTGTGEAHAIIGVKKTKGATTCLTQVDSKGADQGDAYFHKLITGDTAGRVGGTQYVKCADLDTVWYYAGVTCSESGAVWGCYSGCTITIEKYNSSFTCISTETLK